MSTVYEDDIGPQEEGCGCGASDCGGPLLPWGGSIRLSKQQIKDVLTLANKYRLTPEFQELYSKVDEIGWFGNVTDSLHRKALKEVAGVTDAQMDDALELLYSCRWRYRHFPDMIEFFSGLLHVIYDLTGDGPIKIGDAALDAPLFTVPLVEGDEIRPTSLKHYIDLAAKEGVFNEFQAKFGSTARFLGIYIAEAHAQDQWPLGKHFPVNQHKTVVDRAEAAKRFHDKYKSEIDIVVDGIENSFMKQYWSHPERFFGFWDGKLMMKAYPKGACYPLEQITDFLEAFPPKKD